MMPAVSPFVSHLAPPSVPNTEANRRPRSSVDVDRPQVDASILGIPQGWDDDPDVNVYGRGPSLQADDRAVSRPHLPPRSRIHLTSRANRQRTQTQVLVNKHDIGNSPPGFSSVSRDSGPTQSRPLDGPPAEMFKDDRRPGMFERSRRRHWEEGIYRVGYEREVLDT